jgi:dihydrofolate reductase
MNISLDGFMAGANCELDWHFHYWCEEMSGALCAQLAESDTLLLGRVTYQAMERYWPGRAKEAIGDEQEAAFIRMMNEHTKVVFSNSLTHANWNHSAIMRGDPVDQTRRLKRLPGKDIVIFGSGMLVDALMSSQLIDEYRLWIHPVVLHRGRPFFGGLERFLQFKLCGMRAFESGVALLSYQVPGMQKKGILPLI